MRKIETAIIILACLCLMGYFSPIWAIVENNLEEHIYTVKRGDTPADILFTLENRYKISKGKILEWNPDMGLHLIYPGQKIKYYLPEEPKEAKGIFSENTYSSLMYIVYLVFSVITVIVLISLVFKKVKLPKARVEIEIGGKMYYYYPLISKDGKYISLHKNKSGIHLRFEEISDFRKSVKGSLKKDPILIEREIKAGRLIRRK